MNVFDLFASLSLNTTNYESGLGKAKDLANNVLTGVGVAVGAASTAVAGLVTASTNAYAQYEQLAGGVETLFGESADKIKEYAERAYETAGMSANEYMETSIQSAAALINSLQGDQAKAAELMDMSITDMSDNVNKMGTTMEAVQNAYRGFSRGNFTMLDNLALGFAGTKEGMQELLDKAHEFSGIEYDISSYADIVEAIHVVQQEMGISGLTAEQAAEQVAKGVLTQEEAYNKLGTTAKEAKTTIEGSFKSLSAAWENLIAGFAQSDVDLGKLIGNLVDNAEVAFKNMLPVAEQALLGVSEFITRLAPIIAEKIPEVVTSLVPTIISTGVEFLNVLLTAINDNIGTLITGAVAIVTTLVNGILGNLPIVANAGVQVLLGIADGIGQALPELIPQMLSVILKIVEIVTSNIGKFITAGIEIILGLIDGLIQALPQLIQEMPKILMEIVTALSEATPQLLDAAVAIITALTAFLVRDDILEMLINAGFEITTALLNALIDNAPELIEAAIKMLAILATGIVTYLKLLTDKAPELVDKFGEAIISVGSHLDRAGKELINRLAKVIKDDLQPIIDCGKNIVEGLWNGIKDKAAWLKEKIQGFSDEVLTEIKAFFGIASPSKVMRDVVGKNLVLGIVDGIEQTGNKAISSALGLADSLQDSLIGGLNSQVQLAMTATNAQMTQSGQGGTKTIPVILNIDGQTIAKALYPYNRAESDRVGINIVRGGV